MKNTEAVCVACGERFDIGPKPIKGQFVDCPACDTLLEIVSVSPVKLDWLEDEFDYEDDDDYDDDRAIFDEEDDEFDYDFDDDDYDD